MEIIFSEEFVFLHGWKFDKSITIGRRVFEFFAQVGPAKTIAHYSYGGSQLLRTEGETPTIALRKMADKLAELGKEQPVDVLIDPYTGFTVACDIVAIEMHPAKGHSIGTFKKGTKEILTR